MTTEQRNKWIGFDLGGTKMLSRVYDGDFKPLGWNRKKTKAHLGTKAGLERVVETIRDALKDADVDPSEIAGIGIGCPGPIDMEKGVVLDPPNLGWGKVSIRKHLEQEFGCPVAVANDVDAGVYGEYRFGSAKGVRTVIGVFPGTGIGGGCIYEGQSSEEASVPAWRSVTFRSFLMVRCVGAVNGDVWRLLPVDWRWQRVRLAQSIAVRHPTCRRLPGRT